MLLSFRLSGVGCSSPGTRVCKGDVFACGRGSVVCVSSAIEGNLTLGPSIGSSKASKERKECFRWEKQAY